jgi:hypothetical protein
MLGWMMIFVLMILGGTLSASTGAIGTGFVMTFSAVFGILLLISAFTLVLRSRAR